MVSIRCNKEPEPASKEYFEVVTAIVDDEYLVNADSTPENWVTCGKNYAQDWFIASTQGNS